MWQVWITSKAVASRPSTLLEIEDPYIAYCFDEAVTTWGSYIEGELSKIEEKDRAATERALGNRLRELLGQPKKMEGHFRDPADLFK